MMTDGESPMQGLSRLDAAAPPAKTIHHSHSASFHENTNASRDAPIESRSHVADHRHTARFVPIESGTSLPPREPVTTTTAPSSAHNYPPQLSQSRHRALSRSTPQATASSNGPDPVFTPPASGGRLSPGSGSAHGSSQESQSQLLQLSQIAAAQQRIPEDSADMGPGASRKRMADGMVKHTREKSNVSPGQVTGHSRNTSTVSVASTSGSRIGELSAELRARLSYAMVKVNHGWQSHSIDQVETLASQATSPASSASTIHLRNASSASPQLSASSHRASNNTTPATGPQNHHSGRPGEPQWRDSPQSASRGSSASPVKSLAPPVSIQPLQHASHPRREANPRQVPAFLSHSQHASPRADMHTSPYLAPGRHRSALSEAMLVSPHTNVREQDAIESLLFMSSPGNSANLKHAFPSSSSQPLPSTHAGPHYPQHPQRHALPTSQPRKSLPSGRPGHHARSHSHSHAQQPTIPKRVGFEKSPSSAMDIDDPPLPFGSPMSVVSRGTPRQTPLPPQQQQRRTPLMNGSHDPQAQTPRLKQLPVSAGLTLSSKPRPVLADADIDAMLDRAVAAAAADGGGSDSDEGEICIPVPGASGRARREGAAGVVGV